jgi:hypothetical protein
MTRATHPRTALSVLAIACAVPSGAQAMAAFPQGVPVPPVAPASPAPAAGAPPAAARTNVPPPPWWAKMGLRALEVETRTGVLDQVVLVPDEAAYLREIARWTPKVRWPVLIEDAAFAPRFVRAFKPAQVLRRGPAEEPLPAEPAARRTAIEAAVVRALGGTPGTDTPSTALRAPA